MGYYGNAATSEAFPIAVGAQPILGFNYGDKKLNRVKETVKIFTIIIYTSINNCDKKAIGNLVTLKKPVGFSDYKWQVLSKKGEWELKS